jgi:asparagine synthase (glutamine-hydrolysing)
VVARAVNAIPASQQKVGLDEMLRRFVSGAELDADQAHYAWRTIHAPHERASLLAGQLRRVANEHEPFEDSLALAPNLETFGGVQRFMYFDIRTWLPNDVLVKADRTSMAHSLEVRAPFLDHRLVEFALRLPPHWLLRGTQKKVILKEAMRGVVPDTILHRRKRGFNAPVKTWMTGPLRELVHESVSHRSDGGLPYFERGALDRLVADHDTGRGDHALQVWGLLTFHLWHDWMRAWRAPVVQNPLVEVAGHAGQVTPPSTSAPSPTTPSFV